jgi:3'-phosphoadenosine 5'-phosphosulfate sulfotransferase (PAPS reductase)/FAD synthetase
MDDLERRKFELHAQQDAYQDKLADAERYVNAVFDRYANPHVEFSGGKDSLVTLHLVADRCGYSNVDVFHFENAVLGLPGVTDYARTAVEEIGGTLVHRAGEKESSMGGFWTHLSDLYQQRNWDVRVMGIRAEESNTRRDRVDDDARLPVTTNERFDAAFPICQFSATDVWAYIVDHNLPYFDGYDEQAELYGGMDAPENRLSHLFTNQFDSLGLRSIAQFVAPSKMNQLKNVQYQSQHGDTNGHEQ